MAASTRKSSKVDKDTAICFQASTLLTIVVGTVPHQERFCVHEGIICARSEFFRRAMNGNWAEQEDRLVPLPEDEPEVVATYINLLYTKEVVTQNSIATRTKDTITDEFLHLSKLYVLAEKLCDPAAKNAAIEALLATTAEACNIGLTCRPPREAVQIMHDGSPAGSHGRRLIECAMGTK